MQTSYLSEKIDAQAAGTVDFLIFLNQVLVSSKEIKLTSFSQWGFFATFSFAERMGGL